MIFSNSTQMTMILHLVLRMSFPTVTSNTTPMSVLPQWVDVLGKKIDKIMAELDWSMFDLTIYYAYMIPLILPLRTAYVLLAPLRVMRFHLNKIALTFFWLTSAPTTPSGFYWDWWLRLVKQMESVLGKIEAEYEKLTTFLSEATVNPEKVSPFLDCMWVVCSMNHQISKSVQSIIQSLMIIIALLSKQLLGRRRLRSRSTSWCALS